MDETLATALRIQGDTIALLRAGAHLDLTELQRSIGRLVAVLRGFDKGSFMARLPVDVDTLSSDEQEQVLNLILRLLDRH